MPHTCPAMRCTKDIADDMVMCRTHWFMVPEKMRARVWFEYYSEPESHAHLDAIHDAITAVNDKILAESLRPRESS